MTLRGGMRQEVAALALILLAGGVNVLRDVLLFALNANGLL